jgi:uncharacterized protein (DUF362 family)
MLEPYEGKLSRTVLRGLETGNGLRLLGVGPLSCESVEYQTIIASNDVVTADSIASQMMGFMKPEKDIEHIRLASVNGLGRCLTEI